jgi:asparagine synthase (glutamine-hydrolysing)
MCGIACYIGNNKDAGYQFATKASTLLEHRGPDDSGIFNDEKVTLLHRRLSILELSELGHQPMVSSDDRYSIVFNGEIYNHLELRKKHLPNHRFKGHSDTETILELFRLMQEKMLAEMVGMWAIFIWDKQAKKLFVSRDRYGQKPIYIRRTGGVWILSSEVKPLLGKENNFNATAVAEYLALGNYGHLGVHTFYKDILQFPQGSYAWITAEDTKIEAKKYWVLPNVDAKDKIPFDEATKKELHDRIVEGVLSQTLADVPIGITLSGGIDSSIVAGILATHYDKKINIFTAQSPNSRFDETKYVDAVIEKFDKGNFIVHRKDLNQLSIKDGLTEYIKIQEEPFGDPSIMAHGFLMNMAAAENIKVILNGQGADELFFGYNNMARAILLQQARSGQFGKMLENLKAMKLGRTYMLRTLLGSVFPAVENNMRSKSRIQRRNIINPALLKDVDDSLVSLHQYNNVYDVWQESIYGVHIPHLVHYDDRNGMACSIEGRMPFLDHRIAEYVATIQPNEFLKHGRRKYILREACKQYLPEIINKRTDKIGFFTPLIDALDRDKQWVTDKMKDSNILTEARSTTLLSKLAAKTLNIPEALEIWRSISLKIWMDEFGVMA